MHNSKKEIEKNKALGDIRVLDLAGPMGIYCTKLLADLGADVIKIEPPSGDETRRIGPFFKDEEHPEKSLYFFHYNTNKRSITLNIDSVDGLDIFKRLAKTADIVVERKSQKIIIIGSKGDKIKKLGQASRAEVEEHLQEEVFLELFVKVREKWRDNPTYLKSYGY